MLQCVFLDIPGPVHQFIGPLQDGFDFFILQRGRDGEIIPGQFQIVLGPLAAGCLDLAEAAVVTGFIFALTFRRQFCRRLQHRFGPLEQFFLAHGAGADVVPAGLEDSHGHLADIIDAIKQVQRTEGIAHHLRILLGIHQDSQAMLVIDDCQGIVGYDEAVACSKTAWHPLGKVQPLFDHDHRVLAGCFGCGQAFHDELRVFISAFRHLLIKERESLRRVFQLLPQRRLHLEFTERMGICSLAGEFTGGIRQLGTFLCRRRAGQPAVAGRCGQHRMFIRHGQSPPVPSGMLRTVPHQYRTACPLRTSG